MDQKGIDGVIIATPWEYHAPMAIAAMQAGVAVGCEVVAGITLQDHWDVLKTQLSTGTPYMLLENVCYRRDVMAALQMVRQGLFGELVHLQAGYQHDLRGVKFNSGDPNQPYDSGVEFGPGLERSPLAHRAFGGAQRRAVPQPRHRPVRDVHRHQPWQPLHPHQCLRDQGTRPARIHRGQEWRHHHPSTKVKFKLGDIVTTTLACENGETILLQHDTSLPRRTRWASACRAPRVCGWT